jgi:multiple inositol-polyphosphate phosphatase/2,3-bisphosphoglycerate 3-phosphatase
LNRLQFYESCPKWTDEVNHNPETYKEHDDFIVSSVMNSTIAKVSKRAGLARNLTLGEITIIYTTCAFETAWEADTISPWCGIFDLEDFKVRHSLRVYVATQIV